MKQTFAQLSKAISCTLRDANDFALQLAEDHGRDGGDYYASMRLEDHLGHLSDNLQDWFGLEDRQSGWKEKEGADGLLKRRATLIREVDRATDGAADLQLHGALRLSIVGDLQWIERAFHAYELAGNQMFARDTGKPVLHGNS